MKSRGHDAGEDQGAPGRAGLCEGAAFAAETRTKKTTQRLTFCGLDAGPGAPRGCGAADTAPLPAVGTGAPLLADGLQAALRTSRTAARGEWRVNHRGRTPQWCRTTSQSERSEGSGREWGEERSKCGCAVPPRLGVGS